LGKRTGYIFLESPDQQEELASYLKDREAEGLKSVHFYFPNDLDASTKLSITWSLMPDFQPELRLSQISVSKRNKTIIFDSTLTRVWLLSFTESKSVQSVLQPNRVITYTPDGRMSVVIIDRNGSLQLV
jgi:Tol biopolymer transport system component